MSTTLETLFISSDEMRLKRIQNFIHSLQIADFLSRKNQLNYDNKIKSIRYLIFQRWKTF